MNKTEAEAVMKKLRQELRGDFLNRNTQKEVIEALKFIVEEVFYYKEEVRVSKKKDHIFLKTTNFIFEFFFDEDTNSDSIDITIGKKVLSYCDEHFDISQTKIDTIIKNIQEYIEANQGIIEEVLATEALKKEVNNKYEQLNEIILNVPAEIEDKVGVYVNDDGTYGIELENLTNDEFTYFFNLIIQKRGNV